MNPNHTIRVTVNGLSYTRDVPSRLLLSDFLRDHLNLTGTHVGCEHGICGACTILIDGVSARSCLCLAVQVNGKDITTVEGLGDVGELNFVQQKFREHHALQCGFCTPGFLLTVMDLLAEYEQMNAADIRDALSGNICRCTGYEHIVQAMQAIFAERDKAKQQ